MIWSELHEPTDNDRLRTLVEDAKMKILAFAHGFLKTHSIYQFFGCINLHWKFNNPAIEDFRVTVMNTICIFTTWTVHWTNIIHLELFYSLYCTFEGLNMWFKLVRVRSKVNGPKGRSFLHDYYGYPFERSSFTNGRSRPSILDWCPVTGPLLLFEIDHGNPKLNVRSRTPLNSDLKSVWKHFFVFTNDCDLANEGSVGQSGWVPCS